MNLLRYAFGERLAMASAVFWNAKIIDQALIPAKYLMNLE